jgi:hypothetical protein
LNTESVEQMILQAAELQEKIEAADLAGLAETSQLTAEEQEVLDELEASGYVDYSEEWKLGQPTFLFVLPITEAQREKALAEAFQEARQEALRLAAAAGTQLGALRALTETGHEVEDLYAGYQYDEAPYYRMMLMQRLGAAEEREQLEAVSLNAGQVRHKVAITAAFAVDEPK